MYLQPLVPSVPARRIKTFTCSYYVFLKYLFSYMSRKILAGAVMHKINWAEVTSRSRAVNLRSRCKTNPQPGLLAWNLSLPGMRQKSGQSSQGTGVSSRGPPGQVSAAQDHAMKLSAPCPDRSAFGCKFNRAKELWVFQLAHISTTTTHRLMLCSHFYPVVIWPHLLFEINLVEPLTQVNLQSVPGMC